MDGEGFYPRRYAVSRVIPPLFVLELDNSFWQGEEFFNLYRRCTVSETFFVFQRSLVPVNGKRKRDISASHVSPIRLLLTNEYTGSYRMKHSGSDTLFYHRIIKEREF